MPQLRFHAIGEEKLASISTKLLDELVDVVKCPRDHFVLELINSTYFFDGVKAQSYPFVEVAWFDRGLDVQDKVASLVTKLIQSTGYPDVEVVFTEFKARNYYENGNHF